MKQEYYFELFHLDSGAQINPTGIPMINAGFTIPSLTISITSINTLRSMSQGRAQYSMFFDHYSKVPQNVQDEVTKKIAG